MYVSGTGETDPSQNVSYAQRDATESPKTQAMCDKLQEKWPSLLGDGATGCSWEWGNYSIRTRMCMSVNIII